jgi:hypothetical protein
MYKRCLICGKIFEIAQRNQKICTEWTTRYSRDACHLEWNRVYHQRKYRRNYRRTTKPTKKLSAGHQIKLPSGCIAIATKEGRCKGWQTCGNRRECLMALPDNWRGFEVIDMQGYREVKSSLDVNSQHPEHWEYHQIIYNV